MTAWHVAVAKLSPPRHALRLPGEHQPTPAVFFDRDGTLMEDADYPRYPSQVAVYADAAPSLARLRAAGFRLVLVTNQSGLGRGYFTELDYRAVHAEFLRQLGPGLLDAAYHCPDAPDAPSTHRKPAPGMVLDAARDLGLDLARSYVVGDKATDVGLAAHTGLAGSVLVLTGKGQTERVRCQPDHIADTLAAAADWILQQAPAPGFAS